jgi:hypothetical protein
MQDKIDAYRQRQKDRRKSRIVIVLFWVGFAVVATLVSIYAPIASNIFVVIAYFGFFITYFAYLRSNPPEKYEIRIGADFLEAMSLIKMSETEKGRAAARHRKRAAKYVERAIYRASRLSELAERSEIMEKEMCERLNSFIGNVQEFVLPRIVFGDEQGRLEPTLNGFSKFFAEQWESHGMKQLDDINQNLQNIGKPSKEIRTFLSSLHSLVKSKPITLILSLTLGFGLTTLIIFGFLTTDATQWIKSNIGTFILAGTALSGLIAGIFIRS